MSTPKRTVRRIGKPKAAASKATGAEAQAEALIELFLRAGPHSCAHWNTETGELFELRSKRGADAAIEAFEERLFAEDGWIEVPWQASDEAFSVAQAFAEELDEGPSRAELLLALEGDKPFRGFRAVLAAHPALARHWRDRDREAATWRLVEMAVALEVELPTEKLRSMAAELAAEQGDGDGDGEAEADASMPTGLVPTSRLSIGRPSAGQE
jgi:hypothetical protein